MQLQSRLLARCLACLFLTCAAAIPQWGGGGGGGGGGGSFVHGLSLSSVDDSFSPTTTTTSVFDLPPRASFSKHHQLLFNDEYHEVKILTNFCGFSIANGLKEYFSYLGVSATIVESIDEGDVERNVLYIALFAFLYDFPPGLKFIAYQLEQKQQSAWFNDKYRKNLAASAYVFDYSVQNYQFMELALQKKTIYLPVPLPLVTTTTTSTDVSYSDGEGQLQQREESVNFFEPDVLFYGSLCARRSRVLDELQNKHDLRIKVVTGVYGEDMAEIIKRARVVLNLHYYENALLETTRINEVLQHDRIVVSEDPAAEDKYSRALYKDAVIFTKNLDEHADDRQIAELATTLRFYSDPANYRRYVAQRQPALAALKRHCFGRFVKALISIQAFPPTLFYERLGAQLYYSSSDSENSSFGATATVAKTTTTAMTTATVAKTTTTTSVAKMTKPKTIYYLSLDEAWQTRRELFQRQPYLPPDLERIAAVKAWPGLLGSGMSYKFALNSAKLSDLAQITLCEDDVEFPPTFQRDYEIVLEYLSTLEKWDVFVGLIADVDDSTRVLSVEKYKGLEFVEIDKFSSTVFNIYNASSYDRILGWSDDDDGDDAASAGKSISSSAASNSDDARKARKSISNNSTKGFSARSRKLTIITTNPPIVKHMELGSTSWGNGREYPPWFATPASVFARKVEEFKQIEKATREAPSSLLCKDSGASCRRRRRHRSYRARKGIPAAAATAAVADGGGGVSGGGGAGGNIRGGGTADADAATPAYHAI